MKCDEEIKGKIVKKLFPKNLYSDFLMFSIYLIIFQQ